VGDGDKVLSALLVGREIEKATVTAAVFAAVVFALAVKTTAIRIGLSAFFKGQRQRSVLAHIR